MPLFDHFDRLSPIYDRLFPRDKSSPLKELLQLPINGRLLDAAGGTGRISANFVGLTQDIIVADESPGMVSQARSKKGVRALAARVEALPFPSGCFERVMMVDAYHHLADQQLGLQETWRTLTQDGQLIIEEPDISVFAVKLVALVERSLFMRSRFRSAGDIAADLGRLGGKPRIVRKDHSFWVIATKAAGPQAGGGTR